MTNLAYLLKGELQRMQKYHILSASFVVALVWIGVLHFAAVNNLDTFFPLLLFMDATMMAILMVGVTMFFEKQEGTLKTLLVSPINKFEYILAKSFANIVSNFVTFVLLYAYAWFFRDLSISFFTLVGIVFLISLFHSFLGFILMYYTKDFTSMLMGMMAYMLLMAVPVILNEIGVWTGDLVDRLFLILPTKASSTLLFGATGLAERGAIIFSATYLIVASIALFYVVQHKFDEFAVKESGV